mgnify:CR=1 FL=1
MARVYGIKKRLEQNNISEETIKEIIGKEDLRDIVIRMESKLDPEIVYKILDSCACGISLKELKSIKKIEADSIESRIAQISKLNDFHSDWDVKLINNNTLTGGWAIKTDNDKFSCACSAVTNKKMKVCDLVNSDRTMPLSYCFCCAGHCRRHLEMLLGIQLKTRKIVSSPINSNGENPCCFIFDILSNK